MINEEIAKIVHDYIKRGISCDYDIFNSPPPPIPIRPVKVKSLKERLEEQKMNATSTENFHDIIAIDFELQTFPDPDTQDKFIVSATNRDDIFCFVFEGPDLADACRKAGLLTSWEKDQKIRELEKELSNWKKETVECLKLRDKAQKEAYKLKKENEKLKQLKTPTIENFSDDKPSSRADILDLAKKCVCGKREQDYGTPESNFQLIADLWNDYLGNKLSKEKRDFEKELGVTHNHKELSVPWEISAMDVSMMMALMKIARIRNGGGSGDSFVDLAGYAACGGEIWHSNKETNTDSN